MNILNEMLAKVGMQRGIKKAIDHAEEVEPNWSEQAYEFLTQYVSENRCGNFMAEDVRIASIGIVPEPPSNRAWGGIIRRAANSDLIMNNGYAKTSNPKAHGTPAAVWTKYDLPF